MDDDEDIDDDDEDDDDSDNEDIEIPPDPAHEARMAELRLENARVMEIVRQQDKVIEAMKKRTHDIIRATEAKRKELEELRSVRIQCKLEPAKLQES